MVVADVDPRKEALATQIGAEWTTPDDALTAPVDVVVPCALGAVLNDDTVPRLRCAVVAGAANNQLADDRLAEVIAAAEILWAPDFVANAGGLINIAHELGGYDPTEARRAVRNIGPTLELIFDLSSADSTTPLTAALDIAGARLASASA